MSTKLKHAFRTDENTWKLPAFWLLCILRIVPAAFELVLPNGTEKQMASPLQTRLPFHTLVVATLVAITVQAAAFAATPETRETVELFAAAKAKQIDLKFIPKDATQATVIIRNNTAQPLKIELPKAFVGMPVLAQQGGLGGGGGGNNSGGGQQSAGGGMMGGGGMGGGFFNVGPEKVGKIKVTTVCLEHGKKDPNPRVPYEMKPATEFTQDPKVIEVLTMLGGQQISQETAQAAAWHLTDGLTWRQLAQKVKIKHLNGSVEMFFNAPQLRMAMQTVQLTHVHQAVSEQQAAAEAAANSPGELQ